MSSLLLLKSMLFANAIQKTEKTKKVKIKKVASKKNKRIDLRMCRVCYSEKGDIPLFNNFVQPNIPDDIETLTGVSMSKCDSLPEQMCQSCLDLLNGCIMFRDMCQHTNKLLIELSIKKESTEEYNNCDHKADQQEASDVDVPYNVPSPACSDKSPVFSDKSDNPEVWDCTVCKEDFYDIKSYNNHLPECKRRPPKPKPPGSQIFGKKKTFLCDTCGKTARSRASLVAHMGIHEKVFPFKCDQCPYQGRTMDLLKVHKRSHLVDKPFKCTQCPKATTTSSNLAKHMRHVHSTTRPFKCTYCEKAFSYQHDMKRHVKDIHLRQGTVECDVCYKKFNTKKILQGHRWKIHKIKGERQGRLPSYLQHQAMDQDNDTNMECDGNY